MPNPQNTASVPASAEPLLDQIARRLGGSAPPLFHAVAASPVALQGLWGLFSTLSQTRIRPSEREQIALALATDNGCAHCLALHRGVAQQLGLPPREIDLACQGQAKDPATAAALAFALAVSRQRGHVSETDREAFRQAGGDEQRLVEVLALVALNTFANWTAVALQVPVPRATTGPRAAPATPTPSVAAGGPGAALPQ